MDTATTERCHVCDREYVGIDGGICGTCGRATCLGCFAQLADLDEIFHNGCECRSCAADRRPAGPRSA